jgi:hypothetical protein
MAEPDRRDGPWMIDLSAYLRGAIYLAAALVVDLAVVAFGPKDESVRCGAGHWFDRAYEWTQQGTNRDSGPLGSYCPVPTPGAWALSALVLVAALVAAAISVRRRRDGT